MVRKINKPTLDALTRMTGLEPVNVIRIQWTKKANYYYYADKFINKVVVGKLLSLDGLESVVDINQGTTSTSVKITLDDTNGSIKKIFDFNDIHNRPVNIYQWFTQLPLGEMFLIFEGAIASPIVWSEGDRSISFDVISLLQDRVAGFTVEDGAFSNVPQFIVGKAWPMVFGTVINMPALQMDEMPSGTTRIPLAIGDPNVGRQIDYLNQKGSDQASKAVCLSLRGAELMQTALTSGDQKMFERGEALQRQAMGMSAQVNNQIVPQMNRFKGLTESMQQLDAKIIPIVNGHLFTQGKPIEILINGAHYAGSFDGDNFIVTSRRGPTQPLHATPGPFSQQLPSVNQYEVVVQNTQESSDAQFANLLFGEPAGLNMNTMISETPQDMAAYWSCDYPFFIPGGASGVSNNANTLDRALNGQTPFFAQAGSSVSVGGNYPIRYILSIVPNTKIVSLNARKSTAPGYAPPIQGQSYYPVVQFQSVANNQGMLFKKVMQPIPPQYYTISTLKLGTITATIATFHQPLSTIPYQDWDDDIYATLQSPIGPNVVDIIIWIIQTFTFFAIDFTSFNYVRKKLELYPANFALLDTKNVVDLLKEIAWQSRCSIWLRDGTFFLKYLPELSHFDDTLTEDDIEQQSLQITTTETENLVTRFVATFRSDYSRPDPIKLVWKFNVNKYGLYEQSHDFYIYNSAALVIKSAVFWLIRMCNVWKIIKCKAFLNKLKLETFDTVRVNFASNFSHKGSVDGIVNKATFNSSDFSIDLEIWLPVRLGEMSQYSFAYTSNLSVKEVFPRISDIGSGFTGDISFDDAKGNLGANSFNSASSSSMPTTRTSSYHPSDTYDQLPGNQPSIGTTVASPYGTGTGSQAPLTQQPTYDYRFDKVIIPSVPPETPNTNTNQVQMAQITGGSNTDITGSGGFTALIFPNGINADGKNISGILVPELNPNDIIPNGTWIILISQTVQRNGKPITQYYAQPPVWVDRILT